MILRQSDTFNFLEGDMFHLLWFIFHKDTLMAHSHGRIIKTNVVVTHKLLSDTCLQTDATISCSLCVANSNVLTYFVRIFKGLWQDRFLMWPGASAGFHMTSCLLESPLQFAIELQINVQITLQDDWLTVFMWTCCFINRGMWFTHAIQDYYSIIQWTSM